MIGEAQTIATQPKQQIPKNLIKEIIDGIPFYYRGYKEVINKTKKLQDVMADSGLQLFIKRYIFQLLIQGLPPEKYEVFMGEVGSHLAHKINMSLDLVVYDAKKLTPDKITTKYIDVVPKIVVEIDVNVEMNDEQSDLFEAYVLRKVKRLHQYGAEKVIWIFTQSKTVITTSPEGNWQVNQWDKTINILEDVSFNIAEYLTKKGIQ